MRISHINHTPFKFLNGTIIGIILNKWGGVGMRASQLEPTPLLSLLVASKLNLS